MDIVPKKLKEVGILRWEPIRNTDIVEFKPSIDDLNRKQGYECTITGKSYKTVSKGKDDFVIFIISIRAPNNATAYCDTWFLVRTCKEIEELSNKRITPLKASIPKWLIYYYVKDNLGDRIPGSIIDGMDVKEKWNPKPWGKYFKEEAPGKIGVEKPNGFPAPSGTFHDVIGPKVGDKTLLSGIGNGHQWIFLDHIYRQHDMELDPSVDSTSMTSVQQGEREDLDKDKKK